MDDNPASAAEAVYAITESGSLCGDLHDGAHASRCIGSSFLQGRWPGWNHQVSPEVTAVRSGAIATGDGSTYAAATTNSASCPVFLVFAAVSGATVVATRRRRLDINI